MKKTKGKIEWTVADNEEAWQASQAATQLEPVPKAFYRKEVTLVALIVTLLFLAAGWLWLRQAPGKRASQEAPSTLLQVEQPLTRTLESPNHPLVAEVLQRTGNHI